MFLFFRKIPFLSVFLINESYMNRNKKEVHPRVDTLLIINVIGKTILNYSTEILVIFIRI